MDADPNLQNTGSRPGRLSALRDFTSRFKPSFNAETKSMLLVRLVLFTVWIGATLALVFTHPFLAIVLFAVVMLSFGTVKVDEANRGLPSLLGRRRPFSLPEGLVPIPPFLVTVRSIDTREHQTMVTVRHQSADGLFHDVQVAVHWYAPRRADESGGWIDGQLLLAFDNLEPGVAERRVITLTEQATEPTIASYAHDKLSGINIYQLVDKLRTALEQGVSLDLGAVFARDTAVALQTRYEMARQIQEAISPQLKVSGIVVSLVAMAVVNPDKAIVDLLEEIQRQFVQKSAQGLDIAGDIARAVQFVEAAKARSETVSFVDAYRTVRELDNEETAAAQGLVVNAANRINQALALRPTGT